MSKELHTPSLAGVPASSPQRHVPMSHARSPSHPVTSPPISPTSSSSSSSAMSRTLRPRSYSDQPIHISASDLRSLYHRFLRRITTIDAKDVFPYLHGLYEGMLPKALVMETHAAFLIFCHLPSATSKVMLRGSIPIDHILQKSSVYGTTAHTYTFKPSAQVCKQIDASSIRNFHLQNQLCAPLADIVIWCDAKDDKTVNGMSDVLQWAWSIYKAQLEFAKLHGTPKRRVFVLKRMIVHFYTQLHSNNV